MCTKLLWKRPASVCGAVLLTSLTTVAGLAPILFETSLQAQFLIPMATSIVFGLLYATVLILLVIPALLVVIENARRNIHWLLGKSPEKIDLPG